MYGRPSSQEDVMATHHRTHCTRTLYTPALYTPELHTVVYALYTQYRPVHTLISEARYTYHHTRTVMTVLTSHYMHVLSGA